MLVSSFPPILYIKHNLCFFRLCCNVSHPNSLYNFTVSVNLYEFRQITTHLLCNLSKRFNLVIVLLLYNILPYSMIGLMKDSSIFSLAFRGIKKEVSCKRPTHLFAEL